MTGYPEVGCGAAIFDSSGRLLLIQRLTEPEAGAWGLPGGKIAEELGIDIEVTGLACIAEILDQGDGRHWVSPIFFARVVSGTPRLMEPEKHGGFGWYALDALPSRLTIPTQALIASLETASAASPTS